MWQRFTESARRVVFYAQEEAGRYGENYVSTEHLLLGIIRDSESVAGKILAQLNAMPAAIRAEIERLVPQGEGRTGQDMQLTPRAKRVIDYAYDEARQLNHNYIGTEHLLLGLLREEGGLARQVLEKLGVTYQKAMAEIDHLQGGHPESTSKRLPQPKDPVPGALGTAHSPAGREYIEVAHDAATFVELVHIFQARDAHGYRSLLQGDQTMFNLAVGTPIKMLVSPQSGRIARDSGGIYIRVLAGDFEGYAGWIFADHFTFTGHDEAPFPPPIGE